MELKMTTINGQLMEVISEKEYHDKWEFYSNNPSFYNSTAVEIESNGEKYILPFRGKTDDRPGIYPDGCVSFRKMPTDDAELYKSNNLEIADFGNTTTIQDFLEKNSQIREMETSVLTDIDSVFTPTIASTDTPEMKAFKEAIISKHIDINKYAPRFGDNFLNDKRIIKTGSITMNKLVSMCENLDIEAELTLRDKNPNVANPMKREITVILTGSGSGDNV